MEFFNKLLEEVEQLEIKEYPISKIAYDHGFTIMDVKSCRSGMGEWRTLFKATKEYNDYIIEIEIKNKDKYKSFGKDDEPYVNKITLFKESKSIRSKEYTYFK
ncbi:hypothetical protein UMC2_35281 [[Clostridium] sordellii]|uniref:hypothetical protein n=1 Tax=Paraclostridium sordellii TaxID=1505 RepID=UPI0005428847|nr:hypothetical protein [Paeniclostridium sordellii]CEK34317.1 hypothetical protein UMC2_35281 [[Clostridium] sordellii] [Paeniclostridium sordellii]